MKIGNSAITFNRKFIEVSQNRQKNSALPTLVLHSFKKKKKTWLSFGSKMDCNSPHCFYLWSHRPLSLPFFFCWWLSLKISIEVTEVWEVLMLFFFFRKCRIFVGGFFFFCISGVNFMFCKIWMMEVISHSQKWSALE